jgi:hypothetical protein
MKTPNQALEPTADRRVTSLSMIKTFTLRLQLALGSGGSALPR